MRWRRFLVALGLLPVLLLSARAANTTVMEEQLTYIGADRLQDALPGQARQIMLDVDMNDTADLQQSIMKMSDNIRRHKTVFLKHSVHTFSKVFLVVLLCGGLSGLQAISGKSAQMIQLAGALGITAMLYSDLTGMMDLCVETLQNISVFSNTLLPVTAAAVSMSGAPAAATALQSGTIFAFGFLVRFISGVLVPAVSAYIALITVNAALGNDILVGFAAFIKWIIVKSLKLIVTIFIAYISLSGTISAGVDAFAVKTAKFAVSGGVPVVGGMISDTTEAMLAGAVVIKNTVGVFGMLGILAICILPFLRVGMNYLVLKAGSAVLSPVCSAQLSKLVMGISDSFGLLLGMLAACCSLLFFQILFSICMVKPI